MTNERNTENIVRNLLRDKGYYDDDNIVVEEQSSTNPRIDKLLKSASKSGRGKGFPEFIITFINKPDDLIVIECKANILYHESKEKNKYKDYAVDGVLLYADYLKDSFNVTAIAVSGENEREKKISSFIWLKENYTYKDIQDKILLAPSEISNIILEQSKPITEDELIKKAIEYNSFLHKYSIPEVERCTLISAILIALQDKPFLVGYQEYRSNKDLISNLIDACKRVLKSNELEDNKTIVIIDEYSKFKNNVSFNSQYIYNKTSRKDEKNTILRDFIILINENILPYINNSQFDVLGKFYTQFIRYAGSDKKTGLVLTPTHITDLFCELADLNENDVVFDECCGTAGFLVSAMNYMLIKAGNDTEKKKRIKSSQLIGIETRSDMFSHACSNMMMRGDGKSHILYGDCFKEENKDIIKNQKPTKAFLNPPYQDGNAEEQLEFVENALDCLVKDGICIAICQKSTTVSSKKDVIAVKERLLNNHTLEATFSMPDDLFHPVGVNTSILVLKAHSPHPKNKKTYFGYYKDDGFVKTKTQGRIDKQNQWSEIKKKWLSAFVNRENLAGLSVTHRVKASDEWCAESYMQTNYSLLEKECFIKTVKDYVSFMFHFEYIDQATKKPSHKNIVSLKNSEWKFFNIEEIFKVKGSKSHTKEEIKLYDTGKYPFVVTSSQNNGIEGFYDHYTESGGVLTIDSATVGSCFYQELNFSASDHVEKLEPKFNINRSIAMFLVTIINMEQFRYGYGRKFAQMRIKKTDIKLPVTKDGKPDWEFMEYYIKSLPYSSNLIQES